MEVPSLATTTLLDELQGTPTVPVSPPPVGGVTSSRGATHIVTPFWLLTPFAVTTTGSCIGATMVETELPVNGTNVPPELPGRVKLTWYRPATVSATNPAYTTVAATPPTVTVGTSPDADSTHAGNRPVLSRAL